MTVPHSLSRQRELAPVDHINRVATMHPRWWRVGLLLLVLTGCYVLLNPHWYADATYYAISIVRQPVPASRPGHALWVPLTQALLAALGSIGLTIDPLLLMSVLTSLATAALVMTTYELGLRLGLTRSTAFAGSALLAGSATALLLGGSGYPSNVAALGATGAITVLIRPNGEPWTLRDGIIACLLLAAGWGGWGLVVLAYPLVLVVAYLHSRGSAPARAVKAMALCGVAGTTSLGLGAFVWKASSDAQGVAFLTWLRSASHNYALEVDPLLDTARSCFGLVRAFLELGNVGFIAKAFLLGDHDLGKLGDLIGWSILLFPFFILLAAGTVALMVAAKRGDPVARRLLLLCIAALLPTLVFAVFYGGTELHMHSTALPLLCLGLCCGLARGVWATNQSSMLQRTSPLALAGLVGIGNIVATCLPDLLKGGGVPIAISKAMAEHLPEGSLVIVTGQDFRGTVQGLIEYRSGMYMHNVSAEVDQSGPQAWDRALDHQVSWAAERGGKIAVLSDLVGIPTVGGLQLSTIEYPVPSSSQLQEYFARFRRGLEWRADRYLFVELAAPTGPTVSAAP